VYSLYPRSNPARERERGTLQSQVDVVAHQAEAQHEELKSGSALGEIGVSLATWHYLASEFGSQAFDAAP
jgi:hypothetical protein